MRVATDGSCLKNPGGKTGWAWVAEDGRWKSGSVAAGSNNIAELMAALAALRAHRSVEELHLMIDSQYVLNIIQKWGAGWRRRGWKKADGSPVANAKLVEKLLDEAARPGLTFEWVKGHNGHWLNEFADEQAGLAARNQLGVSKGRYDPQVIADAFSNSGNRAAAAARKRTNRSVGTATKPALDPNDRAALERAADQMLSSGKRKKSARSTPRTAGGRPRKPRPKKD